MGKNGASVVDGKNGTDAKGRFLPGNQVAVGRHSSTISMEKYRTVFAEAVGTKDFKKVVEGLTEEAKAKRPWAVKLLMAYLIGKPAEQIEITGGGHNELLLMIRDSLTQILSQHPETIEVGEAKVIGESQGEE